MTVTIDSSQLVGPSTWRISWSSDQPTPVTYRIFRDGVLVTTTQADEHNFSIEPDERPLIEILDDSTTEPSEAFTSRFTLSWRSVVGAASYRIEELIGPGFVTRQIIPDDGRKWNNWVSRVLEDDQVHEFRVTAIGENQNNGTPVTFQIKMVRHPDPPEVAYSYDQGTGKVTITSV